MMHFPPRASLSLMISALLCVPVAPGAAVAAPAEPKRAKSPTARDRARNLRAHAETQFAEEDFKGAIESFEEARRLSPHVTDLFNLGRIYEEIGDLERALDYYERFAEQPRLSLERRRAAAERIEVLRKIVVVEPEPEPEPEPTPAEPPPPPPVAVASPEPAAEPSAVEQPPPPSSSGRALIIAGPIVTALGVTAGAVGGVGFGLVARRNSEHVEGLRRGENPAQLTLSQTEFLHTQGRNAESLQIAFIVGGGVMALVGTSLLLGGLRKRKQPRVPAMALGPRNSGGALSWSF